MAPKVIVRKMKPPSLLPEYGSACSRVRSSLVRGRSLTNKTPEVCISVVTIVSQTMPERSPLSIVFLLTSHIESICVLMAELRVYAELFTVVNKA